MERLLWVEVHSTSFPCCFASSLGMIFCASVGWVGIYITHVQLWLFYFWKISLHYFLCGKDGNILEGSTPKCFFATCEEKCSFWSINLLGCLWLLGSFLEYNVKICDLDYKQLSVIFQSSVLWYMFWLLIMPKSWFHIQSKRFMNPSTVLTNCYFLDIEIFIRIIYICFFFFFSSSHLQYIMPLKLFWEARLLK